MIAEVLTHVSSATRSASGDGGPLWLLVLGPGGAIALYCGLWTYYRNTDKSHSFEHETRIVAKPVTGQESKVDEISGTKAARIDNANHTDHRERVQRGTSPR